MGLKSILSGQASQNGDVSLQKKLSKFSLIEKN